MEHRNCVPGFVGKPLAKTSCVKLGQASKKIIKSKEPKKLNIKWINAALLAFVLVPIEDNIAVTQVPILDPITTNSGALPPSPIGIPAIAIEIIIEVMALLLWKIPVNTAPINNNTNGLLIDAKVL